MTLGGARLPDNGGMVFSDDVRFVWDSIPGANLYTLRLAEQSDMSRVVRTWHGSATSTMLPLPLFSLDAAYYWYVTAFFSDQGGITHLISESPTWAFVRTDENEYRKPPEIVPPGPRWDEKFPGSTREENDSTATYLMWGSAALVLLALFGVFKPSRR